MSIFAHNPKFFKREASYSIELLKGEEPLALAVDPEGVHFAVSTFVSEPKERVIARLLFFKVSKKSGKLKKLYTLKFKEDSKIRDVDYYCFYEVNLDFKVGGKPLVLLFQHCSDCKVFSFVFEGKEMVEYQPPFKFHTSEIFKVVRFDGGLWTVDGNGVVNCLRFDEGVVGGEDGE